MMGKMLIISLIVIGNDVILEPNLINLRQIKDQIIIVIVRDNYRQVRRAFTQMWYS